MTKTNKNDIGILILNLGTPDEPTTKGVKTYLGEFLSDPRVIEIPMFIWKFILHLFVLTFRAPKVAKLYQTIWNNKDNESPLLTYTRKQAEKMQKNLKIPTYYAMRYGNPSIANTIDKMQADGIHNILVINLYPQYSATTTATAVDKVHEKLRKMRHQPTVRFAKPYYDNKLYINGLNNSINKHLQSIDFKAEKIIFSYHGIPLPYHKKGDPYPLQCRKTTELIAKKSKLKDDTFITTFQSVFGLQEWVKPYTNDTLEKLAEDGVKNVCIMSPAFHSDCLETLEEICSELKHDFISAGGKKYSYIPCLNDSKDSIDLLCDIAKTELKGWL